jgi:hypothetical protein
MSLKEQFIKVTNLVGIRRTFISPAPAAVIHAGAWKRKEVYLKPGQVVHIRCLCDKRSPLTHEFSRRNYSDKGC